MKRAAFLILLLIALGAYAQRPQGYEEIDRSDYSDDDLIVPLRNYAIDQALDEALEDGTISNANFQLRTTNQISVRTSRFYLDYKFNLTLADSRNDLLQVVAEVRYEIRTRARSILNLDYDYQIGRGNGGNGGTNGGGGGGGGRNGGNGGNGGRNGGGGGGGGSNGGNGGNGGGSSSDYVTIPRNELNSALIQDLVNFGKDFVVRRAVREGALPSATYVVRSISSGQRQDLSDGANYRFDIIFARSNGSRRTQATFTINYKSATGSRTVVTSQYSPLS